MNTEKELNSNISEYSTREYFAKMCYSVDDIQEKLYRLIRNIYSRIVQNNDQKLEISGENSSLNVAHIQEDVEGNIYLLVVLDEFNKGEAHLLKIMMNLHDEKEYEIEIISNQFPAKTKDKKDFHAKGLGDLASHIEAFEYITTQLRVLLTKK